MSTFNLANYTVLGAWPCCRNCPTSTGYSGWPGDGFAAADDRTLAELATTAQAHHETHHRDPHHPGDPT